MIYSRVVLAAVGHAVGQASQPRRFGSLARSAFPRWLDCKRAGMLQATPLHTSTCARFSVGQNRFTSWIHMQILGEEARARVPADFLVQSPDVANPPTLFLSLADMAQRVASTSSQQESDTQEELAFLKAGAAAQSLRILLGPSPAWQQPIAEAEQGMTVTEGSGLFLQRTPGCWHGLSGLRGRRQGRCLGPSDGGAENMLCSGIQS